MAGNKPFPDAGQEALITSEHRIVRSHSSRAKTALGLLVVLLDIGMLVLAFGLGYWARVRIPLLAIPEGQPPFLEYIPTMILQVTLMIVTIYFSRLYHQPRAVSRFDYARNMVGAVTTC